LFPETVYLRRSRLGKKYPVRGAVHSKVSSPSPVEFVNFGGRRNENPKEQILTRGKSFRFGATGEGHKGKTKKVSTGLWTVKEELMVLNSGPLSTAKEFTGLGL